MNLVKKVWYDKDEIELGIITKVLDKYCVPFKTKRIRQVEDIFDIFAPEYHWDIEVELATDKLINGKTPYDFIIEKVQERLDLEDKYDAVEDEHDIEMRKSLIKACGDPFNILSVDPKTIAERFADAMEKNDVIQKALEKQPISDKLKAFWNKTKRKVTMLFKKEQPIKIKKETDIIKYEDLSEMDKMALKTRLPESVLQSDRCVIRRVQKGSVISLSVEIKGK